MNDAERKKGVVLWKDLQKSYFKEQKEALKNWIDTIRQEAKEWKKAIQTNIEELKNGNTRIVRESPGVENLLGDTHGEHDEVKANDGSGRKRRSGV